MLHITSSYIVTINTNSSDWKKEVQQTNQHQGQKCLAARGEVEGGSGGVVVV